MYCVYIIYSQKLNRFYIGTSNDFRKRLDEHNSLEHPNAYTARGIPWVPFLIIENLSSALAYAIEKHIKSMKSSAYIKNLAKYPNIVEHLKERFSE